MMMFSSWSLETSSSASVAFVPTALRFLALIIRQLNFRFGISPGRGLRLRLPPPSRFEGSIEIFRAGVQVETKSLGCIRHKLVDPVSDHGAVVFELVVNRAGLRIVLPALYSGGDPFTRPDNRHDVLLEFQLHKPLDLF